MASKTVAQYKAELEALKVSKQAVVDQLEIAQGEIKKAQEESTKIVPSITKEKHEAMMATIESDYEEEFEAMKEKHGAEIEKIKADLKGQMAIVEHSGENIKFAPLFKKLSAVIAGVKRVPKNGWNNFHKYNYSTETDLLEGVRDLISEAGLMIWVTVEHSERVQLKASNKDKWFTKIIMKFMIGCTETGETLTSIFHGEGEDESDKGMYKAYTNTMKYFLRQTFLIPSGEVQEIDKPMDCEYDNREKPQNNQQGGRKGRGNTNTPQNNKSPQKPQEGAQNDKQEGDKPQPMITVELLKAKWVQIGGSVSGETENWKVFYEKQLKEGKNNVIINTWLDQKIAAKKARVEEQAKQEAAEKMANEEAEQEGQEGQAGE